MVGATSADLSAAVQSSAAPLLPRSVRAIDRPDGAGVKRAAYGMQPLPDVDLVHGLDVDLPLRLSCPSVATVHDLSVFDVPWAFSRFRAAGERLLIRRALARADKIVAVSSFTAERVAHHFDRQATVIPLAPRSKQDPVDEAKTAAVRRRYGLPERFVLQLGSIEPRKDVQLLADVCSELGIPLVLAGAAGGRHPVPTSARHLGYVDRDELAPLLDAATIVAYISRYEGFGLPPLEAMARGRPVVASAVGGLPDVAADGACLVPVDGRAELVTALRTLWGDDAQRHELGRRAIEVAGRLSWQATAQATVAVYRSLGLRV